MFYEHVFDFDTIKIGQNWGQIDHFHTGISVITWFYKHDESISTFDFVFRRY